MDWATFHFPGPLKINTWGLCNVLQIFMKSVWQKLAMFMIPLWSHQMICDTWHMICETRYSKSRIFYAVKALVLKFLRKKKCKNHTKIMKTKTVEEVKMHKFLVCEYESQNFEQSQENFARSHDSETVTFRNSVWNVTYNTWHVTRDMWHVTCCGGWTLYQKSAP